MRRRGAGSIGRLLAAGVLGGILLGGSLGQGAGSGDILNFADVAARHFHALKVDREFGAPSEDPLVLYIDVTGDAAGADFRPAREWLLANLNVLLTEREGGLPLYLTSEDLVGSQGNDALGATIPTGIVVETRTPSLTDCALAHEVGHALGLKHATERADIMATRCDFGKIEWAQASDAEREQVSRLVRIEAVTLTGRVVWAERA